MEGSNIPPPTVSSLQNLHFRSPNLPNVSSSSSPPSTAQQMQNFQFLNVNNKSSPNVNTMMPSQSLINPPSSTPMFNPTGMPIPGMLNAHSQQQQIRIPPLPLPQLLFPSAIGLQPTSLLPPPGTNVPSSTQIQPPLQNMASQIFGLGRNPLANPSQLLRPMNLQLAQNSNEGGATTNKEKSEEMNTSDKTKTATGSGGWTEHSTKDGRKYYFNAKLNSSQWDKPDELKTPEEQKVSAQTPWKEYTASDGRTYWHNKETKQSLWQVPDEILKLRESGENSKVPEVEWPKFESKGEAREHIKILFDEKHFPPKTTWESVYKLLESDKRWSSLVILTRGEKKQLFAEYMSQAQKRALEEERRKRQLARESIMDCLSKWEKITPETTFCDFAEAFHEQEWWNWIDTRECDDLFQDFMDDFEHRFREKNRKLRKNLMDQLREEFNAFSINPLKYTWKNIKEKFSAKDSAFNQLDLVDCLSVWEDLIESTEKSERVNILKLQYQHERKRRDAFINLLEEKHSDGSLIMDMEWKQFFPTIEFDSRFLDMLGQHGSTPYELFEVKQYELTEQFSTNKSIVKRLIRKLNINIDESSTVNSIYEQIKDEKELSEIKEVDLNFIISAWMEKTREKLAQEERAFVKRQRKYFDFIDKNISYYRNENSASIDEELLINLLKDEGKYEHFSSFFCSQELRKNFFDAYIERFNSTHSVQNSGVGTLSTQNSNSGGGRLVSNNNNICNEVSSQYYNNVGDNNSVSNNNRHVHHSTHTRNHTHGGQRTYDDGDYESNEYDDFEHMSFVQYENNKPSEKSLKNRSLHRHRQNSNKSEKNREIVEIFDENEDDFEAIRKASKRKMKRRSRSVSNISYSEKFEDENEREKIREKSHLHHAKKRKKERRRNTHISRSNSEVSIYVEQE